LAVLRVSYLIQVRRVLSDEDFALGYRESRQVGVCKLLLLISATPQYLVPKRAGRITSGAERGEVIDGTRQFWYAIPIVADHSGMSVRIFVPNLSHVSPSHRSERRQSGQMKKYHS
jgi:hypothetical protein